MNIINLVVNIIFPLIPFRVHLLHTKSFFNHWRGFWCRENPLCELDLYRVFMCSLESLFN